MDPDGKNTEQPSIKAQRPSLAEGVDQELTCAVCLERYNTPKVLPCLHLYCKGCLDGLKKKYSGEKEHIMCPKCQEVHELPENGIDGFKTYFTINNLLELLRVHEVDPNGESTKNQSSGIVMLCESGLDPEDEQRPVFARCLTCAHYLCKECLAIHKKLRMSKGHEIVTLEEIKLKEKKAGVKSLHKKFYCEEHEEEVVKLFCKTCKKAICRDCALVKHREHDCAFVRELRPKVQETLEKLMTIVQEKETEFHDHKEHVKNVHKLNKQSLVSCKKEVEEVYQKMIEKLECHRTVLLAEIQGIHDSECKQIDAEESSLALATVRFKNSIRFTRQLLDNGDDVEVMSMSVQAQEALETLGKMTWDKEALKPILLRVKFDPEVTNLKPFGTVLHKIQPDAIVAKGIPTNVDAGEKISFQVQLSSKMSYNVSKDELVVTVARNNHTIPVVVETNEVNCWSVCFVPNTEGLHYITITVANTTKVFPLSVYQPDPDYTYIEVKPQRKSVGDIPSSVTSPLHPKQNQWRNSVPLPSLQVGAQSPEATCLLSEMTSSEPDRDESQEPLSPIDPFLPEVTESRSVPFELNRSAHTYISRGKKKFASKLFDSPGARRYNVVGTHRQPQEYTQKPGKKQ